MAYNDNPYAPDESMMEQSYREFQRDRRQKKEQRKTAFFVSAVQQAVLIAIWIISGYVRLDGRLEIWVIVFYPILAIWLVYWQRNKIFAPHLLHGCRLAFFFSGFYWLPFVVLAFSDAEGQEAVGFYMTIFAVDFVVAFPLMYLFFVLMNRRERG